MRKDRSNHGRQSKQHDNNKQNKPQKSGKQNKHTSHSEYTRRYNKWEGYYLEDCDCTLCQYYQGKKKGCKLDKCCCEAEKKDAKANDRIERPRGWDRRWDK